MLPDLDAVVDGEVDKLVILVLIIKVQYPILLENTVLIKKKNGEFQVCVNFRDLNKACPKHDFALLHMELLINATTSYEALSFMDAYLVYNQMKMHPEDEEMTVIRSPKRVSCYQVMRFDLNIFFYIPMGNLEGYASRYAEMPC